MSFDVEYSSVYIINFIKIFCNFNRTISIKEKLFLNHINLTQTLCVYQSVTVCAHDKHKFITK